MKESLKSNLLYLNVLIQCAHYLFHGKSIKIIRYKETNKKNAQKQFKNKQKKNNNPYSKKLIDKKYFCNKMQFTISMRWGAQNVYHSQKTKLTNKNKFDNSDIRKQQIRHRSYIHKKSSEGEIEQSSMILIIFNDYKVHKLY